ncbi:hypothetical protein SAMN04488065_1310 [Haloplanus vescus]|uniref:IclR helix-turn-helix domain-containing protein n=1 Tax=Haloplanus vescus TaxID=555874 RepID=A0A1H3X287_9EURY|nr:hypothetical protein [Haloplanus vescus]SDZ93519.1 hypothetical protein SAMN04488065_1310 [Haloplanus vescus]
MRIAASFLALLVLLAGTAPAVALADAGSSPSSGADQPALSESTPARIDAPTLTELYIVPDPSGDARWTVSVRYALESSSDRDAFREYGRSFEAGDAEAGPGIDFFRMLASEASGTTDREMAIQNPTRNATVQNGTGVLRLSFTWTNFVTDTDRGFVIREAVLMPGNRTWLSSIGPSQRLVVETPDGYQVTDSRFGLDNGSVVVDGPHRFREPLTISYEQTEEPDPSSIPWELLVGAALLLGGGAIAAAYARSRGFDADSLPTTGDDGRPPSTPVDPETDAAPSDGDGDTDDADGDDADDGDEAAGVDPELLSDEERVEHLLDQNGGRMKQAQIVKETGWSDAKVSQLLSTMADEGRVEKLRLGRENLISLPDDES